MAKSVQDQREAIERDRDDSFPIPGGWNAWGIFLSAYLVVSDELDKALREEHGLSLTEYAVMYFLHRSNGRQRCIDLARKAFLTQSRVTRHLDKLETRGYTIREATANDRRVTFAVLTAKGESAYQEALVTFAACYERHFASLIPNEDRPAFVRMMTSLSRQTIATEPMPKPRARKSPKVKSTAVAD